MQYEEYKEGESEDDGIGEARGVVASKRRECKGSCELKEGSPSRHQAAKRRVHQPW